MALFYVLPFITIEEEYIMPISFACIAFMLIKKDVYKKVIILVKGWALGELKNETELSLENVKSEIKHQQNNFRELSKLYMASQDSRQILSYQFSGMERVIEKIMRILDNSFGQNSLNSCEKIDVEGAIATYAKEGVCGDSSVIFHISEGMTYMILSDGMGQGERAATESKIVVETMKQLLDAGFDVDLALKTINGIMLRRSPEEIFSTLDMACINKRSGKARLFKMGAATSFIKRGEKLALVKAHSLPIGVVERMRLEYIELKMKKDDLLIMVSDGVMDSDREDLEGKWLERDIKNIKTKNTETIADFIIQKAIEKYGERERDDLSVLVAKIH